MTLDNIKNQTTWSDAAASLNKNFAKLKAAIVTGGGGNVDNTLVRVLYWADESAGETLTEEQKAYNAETYIVLKQGKDIPIVSLEGIPCVWTGLGDGDDYVHLAFSVGVPELLVRVEFRLHSDGLLVEYKGGVVPVIANLEGGFDAAMYWMSREIIPEAIGVFYVDGVAYEVDSWGMENGIPQVEYNEGSRRYRVLFDPSDYVITDKIDITPTGGGGNIDPELLEAYMPMAREFSDDFNNDFSR